VSRSLYSLKRKMIADRAVRAMYDALEQEFSLAHELIGARVRVGVTEVVPSISRFFNSGRLRARS
jgi:hypothetical protein